MREALAARLDGARDELVRTTRALLRIPSANPPGDTHALAAHVAATLRAVPGAEVIESIAEPPFANVAARIAGRAPGRRLVLNGHLDTFPVGEHLPWTKPPLDGLIEGDRLYGRGACDMKGGMACALLAFSLLAERRQSWSGELVVTFAADEESMGDKGTKHMLDTIPWTTGDAMLCGDAGSPRVVRFGEKGLFWVELKATGSAAHGAHVHLGVNAIDRLRRALDALKSLETLPVDAPPSVRRAIAASKPVSEALSGAGEAETLGRVTVNIGTIAGGVSPNLVPATAEAAADIRLPVGIDVATVERRLVELMAGIEGVEATVLRRFDPNFTDPGHEIVRRVADNAAAILGERPAVNMRVGASDARWYRLAGVPTVVYGLTPHNMGGADEWISIDELHAVAKVHTLTAFDFLAGEAR
jgi:acetylornithine deacetylase/succinyl-diaminopimelate desuccinylase-like protein